MRIMSSEGHDSWLACRKHIMGWSAILTQTWSHYMFAKVFRFSGRQPSTRLDFCTKSRSNWSYFYKKPIKMSIYSYSGLSESSFLVTLQIFTTAFGHNAITPTTVIIVMTNNQIRHCYGISIWPVNTILLIIVKGGLGRSNGISMLLLLVRLLIWRSKRLHC